MWTRARGEIHDEHRVPVLDAALIAGGQKVEHYEIASYGTLAYFADLLDEARSKGLLGETLDEEKAADQKLNQIAKSKVNRDALTSGPSADEQGSMSWRRGVQRVAASIGLTHNRSASSRGRRKASSRRRRSTAQRRS